MNKTRTIFVPLFSVINCLTVKITENWFSSACVTDHIYTPFTAEVTDIYLRIVSVYLDKHYYKLALY